MAIERRRRRGRENRIAFELDQGEIGLDALDDGVEEVSKDPVAAGMPALKSSPCSCSTPDKNPV